MCIPRRSWPDFMDLYAGLTRAELDGIAAVLGPRWCMVLHQDLGGEAMAIVMDADAAQPAPAPAQHAHRPGHLCAPTWIVHREGALLRLDVCDGDTYTRIGAYPALAPLLASLRAATEASGRH